MTTTSTETLAAIVKEGRAANCKTMGDIQRVAARHAISEANAAERQGTPEWLNCFNSALDRLSHAAAPLLDITVRELGSRDVYAEAMRRASLRHAQGSQAWFGEYQAQLTIVRGEIEAATRPAATVANIAERRAARPSAPRERVSAAPTAPAPIARRLAPVTPATTPAARGVAVVAALRQLYAAEHVPSKRQAAIDAFARSVEGTRLASCVTSIRGAAASESEFGAAVDAAALQVAKASRTYPDRIARACGLADEKGSARYRRLVAAKSAGTSWDGPEAA